MPAVRVWAVLLAAAACVLAGPSTAAAVGWGITLDGTASGNPPEFTYQSDPYLTELLGGPACRSASATNSICYANVYAPWDAINDGKGSFQGGTCTRSPTGPGTPAAAYLDQVSAAERLVGASHLTVVLTTALPSSPDDIWPTDSEYECGLSGLQRAAPGVTQWEIFNEPDSEYTPDSTPSAQANCTSRNGSWVPASGECVFGSPAVKPAGGNGHGGSAQGAAYWYLDATKVDPRGYTLIAGGFNYSSSRCTPTTCYYLHGYMSTLSHIYPNPPDVIAVHPYIDVDYAALNGGNPVPPASSGLPSSAGAIAAIDQVYPSRPPIWFNEVGVWITDGGKEPVTSGCGDGSPQDDGTWLACLDGNPTAQALAAEGYLNLPSESDQVQRVYYYDFNNQNPGWDSGLVNMSAPLLGPNDYGAPRTAWCVLRNFELGQSPATAAANALQPDSPCGDQNRGDAKYAPVVDTAYFHTPLPASANPPPSQSGTTEATSGQVGAAVALTVAESVRTLLGFFDP
jgi:hypothetical protein